MMSKPVKSFEEFVAEQDAYRRLGEAILPVVERYVGRVNESTETVEEMAREFEEQFGITPDLDEGFFGSLLGGAAGFVIGPTIGGIIARALGIERGVLYDLFTSRLVGTALGAAIAKHLGSQR